MRAPRTTVLLLALFGALTGMATAPPAPATPTTSGGGPLVFTLSDVTLPSAPRLLRAFDTDGDGAPELAVLGTGHEIFELHVTVLRNDGAGAFTPDWDTPHPHDEYAEGPAWIDAADVDLDGTIDVSVTPGGADHSVRLGDGHGRLDTFLHGGWFGGYAGPGEIHDIDGDGLPDLSHFTADFGPYIDWGKGTADGRFPGEGFWWGNPYDGGTLIRFADIDEDGDADPVLSTQSGIYASHVSLTSWNQLVAGAYRGHEVIDLDDDDHLDVVFADPIGDRIGVVLGVGDGSFGAPAWFGTGREPDQIAVADLDGDGELDVVTGNVDQGSISILLGDGAGGFGLKQDIPTGPGPLGVVAGDFDLDGDTDLAVADAGATTVTILLQQAPALPFGAGR